MARCAVGSKELVVDPGEWLTRPCDVCVPLPLKELSMAECARIFWGTADAAEGRERTTTTEAAASWAA